MISRTAPTFRAAIVAVTLLLVVAGVAYAQQGGGLPNPSAMGQQSLRPYWHVFIAYAIAVVFILGWVVSIAKRLANLERRLVD